MKMTARLILLIMASVLLVVVLFTAAQIRSEKARLLDEMERRSAVLAESLQETIAPLLDRPADSRLPRLVERFGNRQRLAGVAIFGPTGAPIAVANGLPASASDHPNDVRQVLSRRVAASSFRTDRSGLALYTYFYPVQTPDGKTFVLAIGSNASNILVRLRKIWQEALIRLLAQGFLISFITIAIIRWDVLSPISSTAEWLRNLRLGVQDGSSAPPPKELVRPLAREVQRIAQSLESARRAAGEEARLRQAQESVWTAERLKEHIRNTMAENPLFIVSNREPYTHVRKGKEIEWVVPAGGLITALEPVLRASGGTWIAHGSGNADRETVDENDHVSVPPDEPAYTLRRVWLTKEEEQGYYYGFSNEGIWPLCHIAHTRPLFRESDWDTYREVNQKFADVTLEEIRDVEEPRILLQDYHFALLPRLIKEKRPDARVALFWHIPWPNAESFGICPWARDLLNGMLGADLIGFHIQYHCNNFLYTVDRFLESRIDRERFAVNRQGHSTWVKPFPISVDFSAGSHGHQNGTGSSGREQLLKDLGVKAGFLGVGVDRIDYTKGIVERFRGVERFLEKNPRYVGEFTFVELGAPSRDLITRYRDLMAEVEQEVERINDRFKTKDWKPLVYLKKHHDHREIEAFYRAADLCMVTSLHDGMNLVAKEFVAARSDEDGVLILSPFAGASRELGDALIVNPYDTEQMAEAIQKAVEMDPGDRRVRMKRMRHVVRDNNIYRWASSLLIELDQLPQQKAAEELAARSLA